MTFIAPALSARSIDLTTRGWRAQPAKTVIRAHALHEDVARCVMGADNTLPAALMRGSSLEHLARIAFG